MNTQMNMNAMNKAAEAIIKNIFEGDKRRAASGANKPTANQVATITKICEERGIPVDESRMKTYDLAFQYIAELTATRSYKIPVSDKQKEKIIELVGILGEEVPDFDTLEGGWDRSASRLIKELNERVKSVPQPLTPKQYEFVLQIEQCPDAEFVGLSDDYEEAKLQMTKQEATDYINKYRNNYYTWIKTRITPDQMLRIIQLKCMIEGTSVEVPPEADKAEQLSILLERQSMTQAELLQLSTDTASEFISQLESEYKSKIWQETTLEPEGEDMRGIYSEHDLIRQELHKFLFGIYASMNQALEEDFMETVDLSSMDELKEVILEAKEYGYNLANALDDIKLLFTEEQKADLLAAYYG